VAAAPKSSKSAKASKAKKDAASAERSSRAEQSIQAFRDAIEKSITISRERLQEIVDDAVKRGRMTRGDAEELVARVVTRSRDQVEDILRQLEELAAQLRDAGSAAGSAATSPRRTAGRAADRARRELGSATGKARADIEGRAKKAGKRAVKAADQPLATADRARRRARLPGFPISAYDQLNVQQIDRRLTELTRQELRRVRTYERDHKARKGVLSAVDRRLGS
jgi:polyhydroxyalkanoate synthesis regulator phasin